MTNPKDPTDAPLPNAFIPSLPGSRTSSEQPAPPRDPSDVDSDLPPTPAGAIERTYTPPAAEVPGPHPSEDDDAMEAPVKEDPKALAKRLAAEAKARAEKAREDAARPASEDPKALAKRLAAEAKARAGQSRKVAAARATEDPKALAKRLAAEAKARAGQPHKVATAPAVEDPKALAKRLAAEAKDKAAKARSQAVAAQSVQRTGPAKRRSAAEILAEARKAEATRAAAPKPTPAPRKTTPAPVSTPSTSDPAMLIDRVLPGAIVTTSKTASSAAALQAVWQSHASRAASTHDASLALAAHAILDGLARNGAGAVAGCAVQWGDSDLAVYVDVAEGRVIAVASPSSVYLAGL